MVSKGSTTPRKTAIYRLVGLTWGVMFVAALPCSAQETTVAKPVKNVPEKTVEKPAVKTEAKPGKTEKTEAKPAATPSVPLTGVTFVKHATKEGEEKVEPTADELAVQDAIKGFADAFNAHDAKVVAARFTELAELENGAGHVTRGNTHILEAFTKLFTEHPKVNLHLEIHSIRFLSSGLAVEEGFSTMTGGGAEGEHSAPHVDRYTITHVKQEGAWLVASARDWPAPPPTAEQQLQQLAWLIGDWVDENSSTTVHTNYHWSKDNRYLMSRYEVKREGQPPVEGLQRIGWDPEARQLRSWTFDSLGGHSQGLWSRHDNRWIVKLTGVMADGQVRSSTNVLTRLSDDHATYQSRDRTIGSELLPDHEPVPIVRKAPEPMFPKK
ncbi:MAG: hypothetical protein JWN70_4668 [Planctomycetaceae bacterium]|nr:hypothetical protein [Planctomycetaceae bacterium]